MKKTLVLFTIALIIVGATAINLTKKIEKLAIIQVSEQTIDYGDIIQNNGPISASVIVSNIGDVPLKIDKISTSCGCTTAAMDQSDLEPNEKRELTITFDPMVHPDQIGSIIRVVYLQTSDKNTPETEINVLGNVIQ